MLHIESVEPSTLELLKRIQALPALAETRLVGGTALALQLGHRVSVDLDIFGHWDLNRNLEAEFSKVGPTEKNSRCRGCWCRSTGRRRRTRFAPPCAASSAECNRRI